MINREAGDKTKGFRLQKLRVAELMLDAIDKHNKPLIYASIEHIEDLYLNDRGAQQEYLEEDKNYDEASSFTLNSHEVVNTLVSFIDIWIKWQYSESLVLGFYSTNSYGKERTSATIETHSIILPEKPLLELLSTKNFDVENFLDCIKKFIKAEYAKQYNDPKHPGRIDIIEKMSDEEWKKFLHCIDWKFNQTDEVEKKKEVLTKISNCKYFHPSLSGKEEVILSVLMDMFDERQSLKDLSEKFVHGADIELKFKQCGTSFNPQADDPVWELWSKISPSDSRNLKDKIEAVCGTYSFKKIQHFALMASRSLLEQQKLNSDKSILSIKYRVYEHCQTLLLAQISQSGTKTTLTDTEIDQIILKLNVEAKKCIQQLSTEYKYSLINDKLIDGLILELFDSCFLAFD